MVEQVLWQCPISMEPETRIFVLHCGHSVGPKMLDSASTAQLTVRCPICREDTSFIPVGALSTSLIRNISLEQMQEKLLSAEAEADRPNELEHRRTVHKLETTQVSLAIAESRNVLTMQNLAEVEHKYNELKRLHKDLAYDVAYNTTSLRNWSLDREREKMRTRHENRVAKRPRRSTLRRVH